MNQREKILEYIRENGSITHLQAEDAFGCTRLAARIGELKDEGYPIMTRPKKGKNRYGKQVTFAEYFLEEAKNEKELNA